MTSAGVNRRKPFSLQTPSSMLSSVIWPSKLSCINKDFVLEIPDELQEGGVRVCGNVVYFWCIFVDIFYPNLWFCCFWLYFVCSLRFWRFWCFWGVAFFLKFVSQLSACQQLTDTLSTTYWHLTNNLTPTTNNLLTSHQQPHQQPTDITY